MTTSTELYWDPLDTEIDTAPYGVWRRLRDEAPLYRNDAYDFWALSRFADVAAAHQDHETYSSSRGTVLEYMTGADLTSYGAMIFMDPPNHTRLRTLVFRAFTPRRVADLEDRIRTFCTSMLDPYVGTSGLDYFQDFAAQLPSMVISALLGVPDEERDEQRRNIEQMFHIEPGVGMINEISAAAGIRLGEYIMSLVERRTKAPEDDLISALCQLEVDDQGVTRRLTPQETALFSSSLYTAGTETVGRLLGNAAVLLAEHPEERRVLVAKPEVIPNAIEELLRFEPPSPVQGRWTTRDVELHGTTVPADSRVLLLTGSAGRDERVYPDPDRFDVQRKLEQTHLSLGYGIHFCVGAALARLEARVALEETLKRFPTWELDRDRVVRQHTSTVRGYSAVPILL